MIKRLPGMMRQAKRPSPRASIKTRISTGLLAGLKKALIFFIVKFYNDLIFVAMNGAIIKIDGIVYF